MKLKAQGDNVEFAICNDDDEIIGYISADKFEYNFDLKKLSASYIGVIKEMLNNSIDNNDELA